MSILGIIAIGIIGAIGYLFMAQILSDYSMFRFPRTISALVVLLGCIGLHQLGSNLVSDSSNRTCPTSSAHLTTHGGSSNEQVRLP